MAIKNRNAYRDAAWDWDFLDECFKGTNIRLSDIDGVVEHNGRFLFIEAKPTNKRLSIGQEILFTRLARLSAVTVLILWGANGNPVKMQQVGFPVRLCTKDEIVSFVTQWFMREV